MGLTLGVDIGGTKVLGGVVDEDGRVLAQARRETPAEDVSRTLDRIIEVITELSAAHGEGGGRERGGDQPLGLVPKVVSAVAHLSPPPGASARGAPYP